MKLYTDGSSTIGVRSAYCVTDENGKVLAHEESFAPNDKTNNEEEYRGIIKALEICAVGSTIFTDSNLVVQQTAGRFKVKQPHLKPLCAKVKELLEIKNASLVWIGRESNVAGKFFE